jgi:hypothetical protein
LLATHFAFEWGVAAMIMPMRLTRAVPSEADLAMVKRDGIVKLFTMRAQFIDGLNMYEQFYKSGWTPRLVQVARRQLLPTIVNTVTLMWYSAAEQAGLCA